MCGSDNIKVQYNIQDFKAINWLFVVNAIPAKMNYLYFL